MDITTTVTWDDLKSAYDRELEQLRDAYEELVDAAEQEYGDDALTQPMPQSPDAVPDGEQTLLAYQQQTQQLEAAAKSIQKNKHVIDVLRDELGEGPFEIKMLTGEETMDIESQLRMKAQQGDVNVDSIQSYRNGLTTDKATVDAPEGVPREDGSPKPSEGPNALTMALWQQVERFNNAGATDFRPEGFGETVPDPSPIAETSVDPKPSDDLPSNSERTDDATQPRGN